MSDDEHDEPAKRSRILVAIVLLPIAYLLSVIPANWLYDSTTSETARSTLERIYYPVRWAVDNCRPFGAVVKWVVDLFD